jgi:hypothetical protein
MIRLPWKLNIASPAILGVLTLCSTFRNQCFVAQSLNIRLAGQQTAFSKL